MKRLSTILSIASFVAVLVACGGGGSATPALATAASAGSASSGTITAFGSIFVNGHEFATGSAQVIDDDTGSSSSGNAGLEVGMSVDVVAAASSSASSPVAAEVHLHPLARGIVDASDTTGGTLTVMGQTVQLTAATLYSDHRACLTATTSPCSPVAAQKDLAATSGAGITAVAGSYVTVHGYLFSGGTPASAGIVATLISVADAPATAGPAAYKAEGVVTAASGSSITIGGLAIDLSQATCHAAGSVTPCAGAYGVGQTVSTFAAAAPSLPATNFAAGGARLRSKLVVETAGASVELEGMVSSVTTSPAAFVLRGVSIDASALTGSLPAAGDLVRVVGTVASDGSSIVASSVKVLHAALSATYGLEGNAGSVTPGSAANTYVLTLLGQSITVDASARLEDRSVGSDGGSASAIANPFNITTFQTYLAASVSQHLVVSAQADAGGNLSALSVTITKASTVSGIAGPVDATPLPVNSTVTGTPSRFSVHGLAVSADPAAIVNWPGPHKLATTTIAAGDLVLVQGSFASGTLTVAAPAGTLTAAAANIVLDFGAPRGRNHDPF